MFRSAGPLSLWFLCIVAVPGCVSVNGCVVSRHPLSDEKTSIAEPRLIGAWQDADEAKSKEEDASTKAPSPSERLDAKPGSDVALVYKPSKQSADDKEQEITVFATKLGERRYLSFGGRDEKKDHDEWFVFQYEWKGDDSFRMRPMDVKVVGEDVRGGRIKGRIEERQKRSNTKGSEDTHPSVELQATMEELREYVEAHGDRLFEEKWLTVRRVKEE
jgi:hypothetical protein